jgi:hypothetical protein
MREPYREICEVLYCVEQYMYCRKNKNLALSIFPSHKIKLNLHTLLETLICMNGLLGGVIPTWADYVSMLTVYFPII